MQRYFVKDEQIENGQVTIFGPDVHHIRNVMRLSINDRVIINTHKGRVFQAEITSITKSEISCRLLQEETVDYQPLKITLAMSLIKRDKFELILQKATELGVSSILPVNTKRTVVKIKDFANKQLRFEAIVKEASEQCERTILPEILDPIDIEDIDFNAYDLVVLAYEREDRKNRLSELLENVSKNQNILIIIGPEGGFAEHEIEYLKTKKIEFVSLGKTILRAETAAIYIISAFKLKLEN